MKHRRFHDKESDFLAFVNLCVSASNKGPVVRINSAVMSHRLSELLRVRWQDIYTQLRQVVKFGRYREIHCVNGTDSISG